LRLELSRAWFENLREEAKLTRYKALASFISDRIDQVNIMTALMWRVLPSDRDPQEFHLCGGNAVKLRTFQKILAAPDTLEAISALKPGRVRELLMATAAGMNGQERMSVLDQALENNIFQQYSRPLARDPLGIELMISFLLRLRREGTRIKLSLTRLTYNIPGDIFMEMAGNV
jgi:vacuolar-type H+-ATPase subunit C/Vma6